MPASVRIRCYAELNDALPPQHRQRSFAWPLPGAATVGEALAALGIAAGSVDLVLVNGASVGLEQPLHDGDRMAVYPVFEGLDVAPVTRLPHAPLRDPRFVLDVHLGRLARRLRVLGFDALHRPDWADDALVAVSLAEHRILLSRDRRLLQRPAVTHGYRVQAIRPDAQMEEVVRRFDLWGRLRPFTRCLVCNGPVVPVPAGEAAPLVPERLRGEGRAFRRCRSCGKVYWEGSHHRRMAALVERLRNLPDAPP